MAQHACSIHIFSSRQLQNAVFFWCYCAQVAYEQEDYYHSVPWLEESVRLFRGAGGAWSPENEGTLEDALDHLAFSHFKVSRQKFRKFTRLMIQIALNSSSFQTGNVSYALSLSQELLHHSKSLKTPFFSEQCEPSLTIYTLSFSDPTNGRVLQNVEKYEKLLVAAAPPRGRGLRRPSSSYLRTRDTYERLCQIQGSQVLITVQKNLRNALKTHRIAMG